MKVETLVKVLGADFYTGVPDSQLKALCNYLIHTYGIDPKHHVIAANEGRIPYQKAKTDKEIEEERRLFYVAMTRAKDFLKICYVKIKNGKEVTPSRFVDELLKS